MPPAIDSLDRKLFHLLRRKGKKGIAVALLPRAARLDPSEVAALPRRLEELRRHGLIVFSRNGQAVVLARSAKVICGTLQLHPEGYGFIVTPNPSEGDYYVPRGSVRPALDGDFVQARLESRRGRTTAHVIDVLERRRSPIVAIYRRPGILCPREPTIPYRVRLAPGQSRGAKDGDLVIADIVSYPTTDRDIEIEVRAVLGRAGDPQVERDAIVHTYHLPVTFPADVLAEAANLPDRIEPQEIASRHDLRDVPLFTIDGENARDFDDAVGIQIHGNSVRVWVAIADVSHYVHPGTALDREAAERGTSVYFPDRVFPMLPEVLSNELCSLKPGTDRLAIGVILDFNADGFLQAADFRESVIRSHARLTYTQVKTLLADSSHGAQDSHLRRPLLEMARLARKLAAHRRRRGSIDFDLPEAEVILDLTGRTENIVRAERHIGHRIIEEFMIAANSAVAQALDRSRWPALHRVHEAPDPDKVSELSHFLCGIGLPALPSDPTPADFQRVLSAVAGRPEERLVNTLLLRSMKQARYSTESLGHFGLATRCYTHFTSPIRRYPDLVVHRLLKEMLAGTHLSAEGRLRRIQSLQAVAEHSSFRERFAMEAERECLALKKIELMQEKIGQEFDGYVSGVQRYGMFVELQEFFVEGLVHISTLEDDHYELVERTHSLCGKYTRNRWRIGDSVRVRLVGADASQRRLDFIVVPNDTTASRNLAAAGRPLRQDSKRAHRRRGAPP